MVKGLKEPTLVVGAPDGTKRLLMLERAGRIRVADADGNLKPTPFLDVSDTVRGFYLAAMKGKRGESYNLCATRTYRIEEILKTAIHLSTVKAEIRPVARLMRPSDEKIIFGSTQKIRKDTGWKPLSSVEQTLGSMLDYWHAVL